MNRPTGAAGIATRGTGQALTEFALIVPIIAILLVAAIDVGRFVFAYNSVTNGAREGARLAIVNQDQTMIIQRAIAQTAIAETDAPNVTIEFWKPLPNGNPSNVVCNPAGFGCVVIVTFETTYSPITPIIKNILFANGVTVAAKSIQIVEFTCPNSTTTAANCPKQP